MRRTVRAAAATSAGVFDYIVVGAGSAGCVLANRLSAGGAKSVLLLEAGGTDWYPWIHVPVGYLYTMNNPRTDWCFKTTVQPGLNDRAIAYPRGRVVGGCSSINGMIYMRGQREDYDAWARGLDEGYGPNPGWSAAELEPFFDAPLEGGGTGEWSVSEARVKWDVLSTFQRAAAEHGIPAALGEFRDSNSEACGHFEVNQRNGQRLSAWGAFINPIRAARGNLTIVTGAHSRRILFNGEAREGGAGGSAGDNALRATGVEFWEKGGAGALKKATLAEGGELILACGAIGSPHLLQCSGVGPAGLLADHGVTRASGGLVLDLPGVGANLHDHLQIRSVYRFKAGSTTTLNDLYHSWIATVKMGLQYIFTRSGPLSMAPSQLGAFLKSDRDAVATPDLQYHVQPLSLEKFGDPLHTWPALTAAVCNLRPTSRGTVELTSADSRSAPTIDPAYLTTAEDRDVAAKSLRITRKIVLESTAFQPLEPTEYVPGSHVETDEELAQAAGEIASSIFHPVGTCKMGPAEDPGAVVDARLRVHGCRSLRVVDASIMPRITSSNTNSPTIAIAEKGAEMILADRFS